MQLCPGEAPPSPAVTCLEEGAPLSHLCTERLHWLVGVLVGSPGGPEKSLRCKEHLCVTAFQLSNMTAVGLGLEVFSAFSGLSRDSSSVHGDSENSTQWQVVVFKSGCGSIFVLHARLNVDFSLPYQKMESISPSLESS